MAWEFSDHFYVTKSESDSEGVKFAKVKRQKGIGLLLEICLMQSGVKLKRQKIA
jgi:hypothetical protein